MTNLKTLSAAPIKSLQKETLGTVARVDPAEFLQRLVKGIQTTVKPSEKLFLTLDEAVEYTGLTRAFLQRAIGEGVIEAIKDRSWKVRRTDLEEIL